MPLYGLEGYEGDVSAMVWIYEDVWKKGSCSANELLPKLLQLFLLKYNSYLDVVWMRRQQRLEIRDGFQRPLLVIEQQCQVEESAAKVRLELDCPLEPFLGRVEVAAIHAEHP